MARKIRFAVGTSEAVRSTIWRLWINKEELYLAGRALAGRVKISFHKSGICRIAVVEAKPRAPISKWTRPKRTGPGAISLFAIYVPGFDAKDAFRERLPPRSKKVELIPPPRAGMKTVILIVATEPEHTSGRFNFLRDGEPQTVSFQIVARLDLISEAVWVIAFQERLKEEEYEVVRAALDPLKVDKIKSSGPTAVEFAVLHSFSSTSDPPAVTDLLLGPEHFYIPERAVDEKK